MSALPLLLAMAVPAAAAAPSPAEAFECRSVGEVAGLAILRANSRPQGDHWRYDPRGQSPFGFEALYLRYSRSAGSGVHFHQYVSVVRAGVEEVRRRVERAYPHLRCLANDTPHGISYTCPPADEPGEPASPRLPTVSLYRPAGDSSLGYITEGTTIECDWDDAPPVAG